MKKLLALSLMGSSLLLSTNPLKADYEAFGVDYSGDPSIGNRIYGVDSTTGNKTLLSTKVFDDNGWIPASSFISSGTGELMIRGAADNFHAYNWKTNTWRDIEDKSNFQKYFYKPMTNADDSTGVISIGENSLKLKETSNSQEMWATDSQGRIAPINITNGSKLLINGRDVEQSINNVGALSAALTGLPTVPTDTTLACGLGTGTHGGDFAFSGGCASKVNEKLSVNYAASMTMPGQDYAGDFEDTFSARAGFVWKLGKSVNPSLISMKAKEKMEIKINALEENNKKIISQNADLKQKNQSIISQNKALLARLERLEKIALGESKSKDLATIKLP